MAAARRHSYYGMLVLVAVFAQALVVHSLAGVERMPASPELAKFPIQLGQWNRFTDDPIEPEVAAQLKADRVLSRSYIHKGTGMVAQSLVVWFNSQRSGERQPHSPKVCLPGSGWIPISSDVITVSTMAASITVNRYVVTNHGSRSVVLYWYQTPRRVTANEWMAKLWLVIDSARDRRSDVALVRIVVPIGDSQDAAMLAAADFAQAAYPLLREILPH